MPGEDGGKDREFAVSISIVSKKDSIVFVLSFMLTRQVLGEGGDEDALVTSTTGGYKVDLSVLWLNLELEE